MSEALTDRIPDAARPEVTEDTVARGVRAFFRVMEQWGVRNQHARILLGRPARATFYKWKANRVGKVPFDTVQRISYVLGIYKALQILYSQPGMADSWIQSSNAAFGGQSALDRMIGGDVTDLSAVRQHLDAVRGGRG